MKKQITTLFSLATTMLLALTFNSCGEEVSIENPIIETPPTQTVFSSVDGDLATRTSMNNKRAFFWEVGDKIWVYDGANFEESKQSSITAPKTTQAKFVFNGSYTADTYKVLYTGYPNTGNIATDTLNTSYNKVTIAQTQTQKAWNDGSHLSTSGDCGVATARKRESGGGYKFTLDHKASYLLLYPYLHSSLTGSYTLESIEIYSDLSASNIAGDYDFSLNGDLTLRTGTGKQEITLNCRNVAGAGFDLQSTQPNLSNANNNAPHCFVVIAPGTHQLTIRYNVKNSAGTGFDFVKDISLKNYEANGVYTFVHELHYATYEILEEFYEGNTFYQWGATADIFHTAAQGNVANTTFAIGSLTTGFWAVTPTTNSDGMPNYARRIYFDNSALWKYNRRNGTQEVRRGGWWMLKKAYHETSGASWFRQGSPDPLEVSTKWHFFPAFTGVTKPNYWWTSVGYTFNGANNLAAVLELSQDQHEMPKHVRDHTDYYVAGYRDGAVGGTTPWFQ